MKTIIHIVKKEFLQFKRDPKMFALILVAPVFQLIVLGFAVNFDVQNVDTVVIDHDKSELSRRYISELQATNYFTVLGNESNYSNLESALDQNSALLGLVIPANFEKNIIRGEQAKVQALFDGSDGNRASIAAGYVFNITRGFSSKILMDINHRSGVPILKSEFVIPKIRVWYNPELLTRNYMVPGIVGLLLMIITLILTSLAIVKEREIGTLEQIVVTPIKSIQLVLGKLIPFALLGFIAVAIVLAAMRLIFAIEIQGSIFYLFAATFIFILSTLGLGIFVSTVSRTQQQAMMIAIFLVMLPMVFLSGFAFPIANMPELLKDITYIIPLRYFMTIIRGVILKGVGFAELWPETLTLFCMGVLILSLSSLRFNKSMD